MAQLMLPGSVHRGPHAWGWMSYSGKDEIDIYKAKGRSDTKQAIQSMGVDPESHWWIGHVRYYTHGSPSVMLNNHPITHGNITGVHNGVISNYDKVLDITGRHNHGTDDAPIYAEVDSEAIFAAINKSGHKRGLDAISGNMAVAYVDHRFPEVVRLARGSGRTLYISRTPGGALIFASEPQIITNTMIECTVPSPILDYRMLTIKQGKIVKRTNLAVPVRPEAVLPTHTGVHVSRVPRSDSVFDPAGVRGITDRMQPPGRTGDAAAWKRTTHSDTTRPRVGRLADPVNYPKPFHERSPLNRKAAQLRAEILAATEATTGQLPQETMRKRVVPSQAYKTQADGTFSEHHGLYWQNGVLVDLDTYVDGIVAITDESETA